MEINVAHLLKSPVGTTREYDLDPGVAVPLDDEESALITGGHVRLDRTNTGILARGHVDATVGRACARCLEPVDVRASVGFAEEYEPSVDVTTGKFLPRPESDLVFTISPHHILDLREAIRQNIVAALPISSLCRPECRGLCPRCGANRNSGECACPPADDAADEMDTETHPFAALADLLREQS